MRFALSPRGGDTRRFALVGAVVGLHLVAAAALVSASLDLHPHASGVLTMDVLVAPPPQTMSTHVLVPDVRDYFHPGSGSDLSAPIHELAHPAHVDLSGDDCRPLYPASAQRAGTTGITRLRFDVGAQGRLIRVQLVQPSGPTLDHQRMDRAAAEALSQCPMLPGADNRGRPVASSADVDWVWSPD